MPWVQHVAEVAWPGLVREGEVLPGWLPVTPLLAIIPARGGSKGIRRKALQPVAGVPLIGRTLDTVTESGVADRIVVSTDDRDIATYARLRGYEVVDRPAHLAADDVPLSDVIRHAVEALAWVGTVAVLQPTAPLLKPDTVRRVRDEFEAASYDWAITAAKAPHIFWQEHAPMVPRVNRQLIADDPKCVWAESGAIQIMSHRFALTGMGTRDVIEIPADEALDVDTYADLAAARLSMGRKRIEFRVAAGVEVGSGHLRRCLQLSDALAQHHVSWSQVGLEPWAADMVRDAGFDVGFTDEWDSPDLLIVDALEAAEVVVPAAKAHGIPVVVFEHDGPACRYADLVVDEFADPKWTILRPEFDAIPDRPVADKGTKVLVTFGGTDPAGLNERVASMLGYALDAEVRVAAGPAVRLDKAGKATVLHDCSMAEQFMWADLVVTGQGRTVAEAVACGTPVVSMAVNERESRHARLPGVLYLGLWAAVSDEALMRCVSRLLDRPQLRAEMVRTSRAAVDGRGLRRVVHAIEGILEGL